MPAVPEVIRSDARLVPEEEVKALSLMAEQLRSTWLGLRDERASEGESLDEYVRESKLIETIAATEAAMQLVRRGRYRIVPHNDWNGLQTKPGVMPLQFSLGVTHRSQRVDLLVDIGLEEFSDVREAREAAKVGEAQRIAEYVRKFNSMDVANRRSAVLASDAARTALTSGRLRQKGEAPDQFHARMQGLHSKIIPGGVRVDPSSWLMSVR